MKKTKRIVAMLLVAVLSMAFLASCGSSSNGYESVVSDVVKAVNGNNSKLLEKYMYKDFGEEWYEEALYEAIEEMNDENYKLENVIMKTVITEYPEYLEEIASEIEDDTDCKVKLEKYVEILLPYDDGESSFEVCLIMIKGRWYIGYIEM